jgi:hypothetical protein
MAWKAISDETKASVIPFWPTESNHDRAIKTPVLKRPEEDE